MAGTPYFPADRTFITPALLRLRHGDTFDPNIFTRWQRAGLISKVRNGLYRRTDAPYPGKAASFAVANQLRDPSYVSLHVALSYWGIIPETVFEITSVTTRLSKRYEIGQTRYSFAKIHPRLFFGFDTAYWQHDTFRIAWPEKAIIDYAYLHPDMDDLDYIYEMRFDDHWITEDCDWARMWRYTRWIDSPTLTRRIKQLEAHRQEVIRTVTFA